MSKRNLLVALLTFALPFAAQAQNVLLPVQGLLTDADNVAVEGSKTLQFELVGGDGAAVWNSSVTTTVTGGLFSVYLGQDTELAAALFASSADLSLKLSIDGSPLGAWPLGVAPYAAAAAYAATAGDANTVGGQAAESFAPADNSYVVGPVQACALNEILKYGQTGWTCAADANEDTNTQLDETQVDAFVANNNYVVAPGEACAEGQLLKFTNGGWACAADDNDTNTYTAGNAISLSNEGQFYISAGAIGQSEIGADAVRASELADNSVDLAAMRDNSVGAAEIINNSVNNAELGDNAVGRAEMQDNAVGTAELVNGAVTRGKLGASGCTPGQILKYGNSGWLCAADGDEDTTYTAGTGLQLVGTSFRIASSGVTAAHLASNSVGASEMADNAIGLAEMKNDSVGSAELRSNSVGTSEIANLAVTNAKLASGIDRAKVTTYKEVFVPGDGTTTANGNALYTAANNVTNTKIILSYGTYDLGSRFLDLGAGTTIQGQGKRLTTIRSTNGNSKVLDGNKNCVVSYLTLHGKGNTAQSSAYVVTNTTAYSRYYGENFLLDHVYVKADNGTSDTSKHAVYNTGDMIIRNSNILLQLGGSGSNIGVRSHGSGDELTISDTTIYVRASSGSGGRYGVWASAAATVRLSDSIVDSNGTGLLASEDGSWITMYGSQIFNATQAARESPGANDGNVSIFASRIPNNETSGVTCAGVRRIDTNGSLDGGCD